MTTLLGVPGVGTEGYRSRVHPQGQRGAIAGQGILHPEPWKQARRDPLVPLVLPQVFVAQRAQLNVFAPTATATGQAFAPNVQGIARPPVGQATGTGLPASIGATKPGFSPPWRPYFEQRDGIGFGQG